MRCLVWARGVGLLDDRFAAAPPVVLIVGSGEVRAAILTRLLVKTPCTAQVRAPSSESIRLRSHPYWRLRLLTRPSHPVRHFT